MLKRNTWGFLCILFIIIVTFGIKVTSTLNDNQHEEVKIDDAAKVYLNLIKGQINSHFISSLFHLKIQKMTYEQFGFKDIYEVNKLEVGRIFKLHKFYHDSLNDDEDLKKLVSPSNTYEVILNLNQTPQMEVIICLDKNNNYRMLEYGLIGNQMIKALENSDENTIMFTTDTYDRYLIKGDKDKVIPAVTCSSDIDELSLKDFVKRYNEEREIYKKIA